MGAGTRRTEIDQRRQRRRKQAKRRLKELRQALQKGRTHADRVKIARELQSSGSA